MRSFKWEEELDRVGVVAPSGDSRLWLLVCKWLPFKWLASRSKEHPPRIIEIPSKCLVVFISVLFIRVYCFPLQTSIFYKVHPHKIQFLDYFCEKHASNLTTLLQIQFESIGMKRSCMGPPKNWYKTQLIPSLMGTIMWKAKKRLKFGLRGDLCTVVGRVLELEECKCFGVCLDS